MTATTAYQHGHDAADVMRARLNRLAAANGLPRECVDSIPDGELPLYHECSDDDLRLPLHLRAWRPDRAHLPQTIETWRARLAAAAGAQKRALWNQASPEMQDALRRLKRTA